MPPRLSCLLFSAVLCRVHPCSLAERAVGGIQGNGRARLEERMLPLPEKDTAVFINGIGVNIY
ncbi:MAG TPA: hypothetical protein DDZ04_09940 [Parabacteroides sp.]|nr:hypothetical protein [Parabacteroides sp.]